jgi:hypothetical protein
MATSKRVCSIRTAGLFGAALAGLMIARGGPAHAESDACSLADLNTDYFPPVYGDGRAHGVHGWLFDKGEALSVGLTTNEGVAPAVGDYYFGMADTPYQSFQGAIAPGTRTLYFDAVKGPRASFGGNISLVPILSANSYVIVNFNCEPVQAVALTSSVMPDAGPATGGTSVAITGTGFTGATVVAFGGTNATSFIVNNDSSITATAPAGSGIVDVIVTTAAGVSPGGAADQFTYSGTPTPVPTVTSIASNLDLPYGGSAITITGTNFLTGVTNVSFGSNNAAGFLVTSATSIAAITPPGTAGTVDVTVTNSGGTSATGAADRFIYTIASTHDFSGDGYSDIFWRDTSGNMAIWEMNGGTILNPSNSGLGGVATTWSIVGQRDFNGDGNADILWRDTAGDLSIWEMNGTTILNPSNSGLGSVSTVWSIVGTGDFNGDGYADILWRNTTTGDVAIWEMNGTTILNPSSSGVGNVATNWTVVGVGDFNGDGKADILWQNTSNGNLAIYLMNGNTITSSATFANLGAYSVVGIGDFNGDGNSDILLRDGSGNIAILEMNGTTILNPSSTGVGNLSSVWSVAETGDFNGDGKSDILWRDTSGNIAIWYMNGTTLSSGAGLGSIPITFAIQGTNAD